MAVCFLGGGGRGGGRGQPSFVVQSDLNVSFICTSAKSSNWNMHAFAVNIALNQCLLASPYISMTDKRILSFYYYYSTCSGILNFVCGKTTQTGHKR